MKIYPTKTASHLAVTGFCVLVAGVLLRQGVVVAWGGAMVLGVVIARAVTLVSVMRIRSAGFEMLWVGSDRIQRLPAGQWTELQAEVRNRDTLAARFDNLRVLASPALETEVSPSAGEVPATGSVAVTVRIRPRRVGHHGVFGLSLEVRGAPGLFEVPLTFANPYGVAATPGATMRRRLRIHGGRSPNPVPSGRGGRRRGDGNDIRELREHLPGDPFRRIAWKASARRGKLIMREFERHEMDVVALILDASVEHWGGEFGCAPLDAGIEVASILAQQHLAAGNKVGMSVVGGRLIRRIDPDDKRGHMLTITEALMRDTSVVPHDRSGWDEQDMLRYVAEHLRPLSPASSDDLRRGRTDRFARRARSMMSHAPFRDMTIKGRTSLDTTLRSYAGAFGIPTPGRVQPDRPSSLQVIAEEIVAAAGRKKGKRASVIHIVAPFPAPAEVEVLLSAFSRARAKGAKVRWSSTGAPVVVRHARSADRKVATSEEAAGSHPGEPIFDAIERAVALRVALTARGGQQELRRHRVDVVPFKKVKGPMVGADRGQASARADDSAAAGDAQDRNVA